MPTVNEARGKIIGFAFLPTGWNYGKGVPGNEGALKIASRLLDGLEKEGFRLFDAFPGDDGSVTVSAYALPDSYDFDVNPSGKITVVHDREDEELFYQEGMTFEAALQKIKEFGSPKWNTSEYSTSETILIVNVVASKATLSGISGTELVSPSYTPSAPDVNLEVFVNTVAGTTPQSPERRCYSGRSRVKLSQTVGV